MSQDRTHVANAEQAGGGRAKIVRKIKASSTEYDRQDLTLRACEKEF